MRRNHPEQGGAPSTYRSNHAELAYQLALLKHTNQEICAVLGIGTDTFTQWLRKHPKFKFAVEQGRDIADAKVAAKLVERAMGYEHKATKIFMPAGASEPVYAEYIERYPPDTAAASLWLRNRQPQKWRDRQEVDLTLKKDPRELTTEDLLAIISKDNNALEPPTLEHDALSTES